MQFDMDLHVDYAKAGLAVPKEQPHMSVYLQYASDEMPGLKEKPMMVVCPGGGYTMRSDREAEPIALKYLAAGFHTVVVHYTVNPSPYPTAVLQLAEAVRQVRRHAKEWHVKADQVYISGFSAGGHLACTLGTLWNDPVFHEVMGGECDWRPDAQVLSYPVVTMGPLTHKGSRDSLLGENPTDEMVHKLSLENSVTADTVPTFLWHTMEDTVVPVENSLQYATALQKNGVKFEMHIYECGVHGLSTCEPITANRPEELMPDNKGWLELAIRFLQRRA